MKHFYITLCLIVNFVSFLNAQDEFITTWRTSVANETITIPTIGSGYNYTVDWGDGSIEIGQIGDATHSYVTAGDHTIMISGNFPRIHFNNRGDKDKLRTVSQWGAIVWTSMENAFNGCTNLRVTATDAPDLSSVTNLRNTFRSCRALRDEDFSNWNVSNVTDMPFIFNSTTFNGNISTWDVGSVTNFNGTFSVCTFNQDITNWNIGERVTGNISFGVMFQGNRRFNQDISNWDTSKVNNMQGMFIQAADFNQNIENWDLTNVTNLQNMFNNAGLSTINYDALLIGWATDSSGNPTDGIDDIPSGLTLNAGNSTYCLGTQARNTLTTAPHEWVISDGGAIGDCDFSNAFITRWETRTANESITIPTQGAGYNYTIDWGDGTVEFGQTGTASHSYTLAGTYTIRIKDAFPRIYFSTTNFLTGRKLKSIVQWGNAQWTSMEEAFKGCTSVTITATDVPDLSQVTSLTSMFEDAGSLRDLGGSIGNWNVSNIRTMNKMFQNSGFIENINSWNVSQVTDISHMFAACEDYNQPLDQWDTRNIELAVETFLDTKVFDQSLAAWDISSMTDMTGIFNGVEFSTPNYDATLVAWARDTSGDPADGIDDIPTGVTLGARNTRYCVGAIARETLTAAPYNWSINDRGVASGCAATNFFISNWQTTTTNESISLLTLNDTTYNYSIDWGDGIVEHNLNGDATHSYAMPSTYAVKIIGRFPKFFIDGSSAPKILTIEQWGSQQWTSMSATFQGCSNLKLNATDVPNLSQATIMSDMFRGCTNFEDLQNRMNDWDVSNITTISSLFKDCTMFNENISNWTFTALESSSSTFSGATTFNQNIANWNMSQVVNMERMFENAIAFNQPIGTWTLGEVDYINNIFEGATAFNQDLSAWNFSNVHEASAMFLNASAFNQDVSSWDISTVENFNALFTGSAMSTENYDKTLIGWAAISDGETAIPANIRLNADANFCTSEAARTTLSSAPYNWVITDGGGVCPTPVITLSGANPQHLTEGEGYTELGATADDGSTVAIDTGDYRDFPGEYTIRYTVTDPLGVVTEATRTVIVETTLSTDTLAFTKVSIYPNPANSHLKISGIDAPVAITMLNLKGQRIKTIAAYASGKISIASLPSGVYLLQITNTNTSKMIRFVKN